MKLKKCLVLGVFAVFCALPVSAGNFELVKGGKAVGKVVLPSQASPSEQFAAKELKDYVRKISGAELETVKAAKTSAIFIGTVDSVKDAPAGVIDKLKKCVENDAFYIKNLNNNIYIIGKKPIGALFGTYTLLEKLGVRWFYPTEKGEYCPKKSNITLPPLDDFQAPSMKSRYIQFNVASYNFYPSILWGVRNKMRLKSAPQTMRYFSGCTEKQAKFFKEAFDLGASRGGHMMFEVTVPGTLFKKHPEYFVLRDGKRVHDPKKRYQRCISNPEVVKLVGEDILAWAAKDKNNYYIIDAHDSIGKWCECDKCVAQGTVNGKYSPANLFQRFAKNVVDYVLKRNPKAKITFLIYVERAIIPDDKSIVYGDKVKGNYCTCWPNPRCYKHNLTDPQCKLNAGTLANMKKWRKIISDIYTYEYFSNAGMNYAPVARLVAKDIKDLNKLGFTGFMDPAVPVDSVIIVKRYKDHNERWLEQWENYYTMAKLQWNVEQDIDKLLDEAYTLYYGKAADVMKKYQKKRLKLWNAVPGHASYGAGKAQCGYAILAEDAEKELYGYLRKAEKIVADDPVLLKRVKMDKRHLDRYWKKPALALRKRMSAANKIVPNKVSGKIVIDGNLDEAAWTSAQPFNNFLVLKSKREPSEKNSIRVAYDKDNIYIAFRADNSKAWSPVIAKATKHDSSKIFGDDGIEVQLSPPGSADYYHIVSTSKGVIYDAKIRDKSFSSGAEVKVKKDGKYYNYEMKIPIAPMKGTNVPGSTWGIFAMRAARNLQPPEVKEYSSFDGEYPHNPSTFRRMTMGTDIIKNGNFAVLAKYKRNIKGLKDDMFPRHWGISAPGCTVNKDDTGNTLSFEQGTIYTYIGKLKSGVKITVEAKGEGSLDIRFRTWMTKRDQLKAKTVRVNDSYKHSSGYLKLSKDYKKYSAEYKPQNNSEYGYVYIYVKGPCTIKNVLGVNL